MILPYCEECKSYLVDIIISNIYQQDEEQPYRLSSYSSSSTMRIPHNHITYVSSNLTNKPVIFSRAIVETNVRCPFCRTKVDMEKFGWKIQDGLLVYENQQMEELL